MASYTKEYVHGVVMSFDGRVYNFLLPDGEIAVLKHGTVHERCVFPHHLTNDGHLKIGCTVHLCIINRDDKRSILPDHRYYLPSAMQSVDTTAESDIQARHIAAMRNMLSHRPGRMRYLRFMDALDSVLSVSSDRAGKVFTSISPTGWISIQYEGAMKVMDYSAILETPSLQGILNETESLHVEIIAHGTLYRAQTFLPRDKRNMCIKDCPVNEKKASCITLSYTFNGERYRLSTFHLHSIIEQYEMDYPSILFFITK